MERDFYTDDFELFLKEKADDYKMFPSESVWKKIHRQLHVYRRWTMFGISALLLGATFLGGRLFVSSSPDVLAESPNKQISPAESRPRSEASVKPLPPNNLIIAVNNIKERKLSNMLFRDIAEKNEHDLHVAWLQPARVDTPVTVAAEIAEEKLLVPSLAAYSDRKAAPVKPEQGKKPVQVLARAIVAKPVSAGTEDEHSSLPIDENTVPSIRHASAVEPTGYISEADRKYIQEYAFHHQPPKRKKLSYQFYVTPTVSYRRLADFNNNINFNSSPSRQLTATHFDLDGYVNHKPALGFEAGSNMLLNLIPGLTLKTGLQFNFSRFQINAFNTGEEKTDIAMNSASNGIPDTLSMPSSLRNFYGYSPESVQNQYMQLSVPVGLELRVAGTNRFSFNVAGAVQPTYLLNGKSYMLSTDYKNYTESPENLVRRWNVHTNLEAYFAFERNGLRWQMGPQFRYQMLSSFQNKYPIREYLIDYGFKVGVSKIFKY